MVYCQKECISSCLQEDKRNEGYRMLPEDRRKRVQRLKLVILTVLPALILILVAVCIFLALKVGHLEQQIEVIKQQLEEQSRFDIEEIEIEKEEIEAAKLLETGKQPSEGAVLQEEPTQKPLRKVYLTFDDGPSQYTEEILDILKEYDVKATFFVTGMNASLYEDSYRRIVEEGHTLGIHSYSHKYGEIYHSLESFQQDWHKMQDYLYQVTGQKVTAYRFPGGSSNTVSAVGMEELIPWLSKEGVVYYDWNISAGDAGSRMISAEEIVRNCIEGAKEHTNAMILLHDASGRKSTIEALPLIIEGIQALEDTALLPVTEETVPIQHISITKE